MKYPEELQLDDSTKPVILEKGLDSLDAGSSETALPSSEVIFPEGTLWGWLSVLGVCFPIMPIRIHTDGILLT
ncbi:hypothetical protein PHLCEN_2v6532 [Hermanssonia centrifuga]|uniref:Uncharacterized protein n=1 Tax=Hermanssonia centrifuga TaxID=98765 RepID=A0A2R6NZG3_9APHY|nr:hypothetical protein PHLCEN_2v6532 [Hermanssonia centrifuga]